MADEIPNIPGGPHLCTVAMLRETTASGAIFGGLTVSQMDLAGATFVAQRVPGRFVTVNIDAMRFLWPTSVGDEVSVYCTLQERSDTSIAVMIETWVRDRSGKNFDRMIDNVFIYVAAAENENLRDPCFIYRPISRHSMLHTDSV